MDSAMTTVHDSGSTAGQHRQRYHTLKPRIQGGRSRNMSAMFRLASFPA